MFPTILSQTLLKVVGKAVTVAWVQKASGWGGNNTNVSNLKKWYFTNILESYC